MRFPLGNSFNCYDGVVVVISLVGDDDDDDDIGAREANDDVTR